MTTMPIRTRTIERKTRETNITVTVDLDGTGEVDVETGVPFLDHMLDALGRHGQLDLGFAAPVMSKSTRIIRSKTSAS